MKKITKSSNHCIMASIIKPLSVLATATVLVGILSTNALAKKAPAGVAPTLTEVLSDWGKNCDFPSGAHHSYFESFAVYKIAQSKNANGFGSWHLVPNKIVDSQGSAPKRKVYNEYTHIEKGVEPMPWMGLTVVGLGVGWGHENGIIWSTLEFKESRADVIKALNAKGFKLGPKGSRDLEHGSIGLGASQSNGRVQLVCDQSN